MANTSATHRYVGTAIAQYLQHTNNEKHSVASAAATYLLSFVYLLKDITMYNS